MASYVPNGRQQFCDQNGKPLALGTVGMYVVGTLTPANTWQDAAQTALNTNPITLDAGGFASIYGIGPYRQIVKDTLGSVIWDRRVDVNYGVFITPQQFGAIGDGIANDTAAFQAAHDALPNGGTIVVPQSDYKIVGSINITHDNVRFVLSGRKATRLLQQTANAKTFNITANYFGFENGTVEYVSQGASGGSAFYVNGNYFYGRITGAHVKKADIACHYTGTANSHYLSHLTVEDPTTNGILIDGAANILVSQFNIVNSSTTLCSLGCIRLYNQAEGCNFVNGQTYQGSYAMTTDAAVYGTGQRPAYCKFDAIYFDSSANGDSLNNAVEMDFNDCWFSNRPNNGAVLNQVDGVRFTGGGAVNCGQRGILVNAQAVRVVFNGFAARSNSSSSANTYAGITFAAGTTDFIVKGCTLTNGGITFGTQKYGVEVVTGASDRYIIADNLVSGNGTSGVSDGGSGSNKRVANNY